MITCLLHTSVHKIHTTMFSIAMTFTATTVFCNSIKDCLKLEISRNNDPGILTNYKVNNREFFLLDTLGTLRFISY